MRVLITGGAGFIGSHTVERFIQEGHEVWVLDDFSTGFEANLHPLAHLVKGDVCTTGDVDHAITGANMAVHLAAFTSVPESFKKFPECNRINVAGTYNVLEASARHGVSRLVFASTSAVYAALPDSPKSEEDCPEPTSPYGVSKLEGEHLLQIFEARHELPSVALRFFNVYGPRQPADSTYASVIPAFISRSLNGQPLTIYGDGRQTRDFVFVKDVTEAIYQAALSQATGVYNVGTGRAVEVLELADAITKMARQERHYQFAPLPPGDVPSSTASIKHIRNIFGWAPAYSLEQGLKHTFDWYREQRKLQTEV